MIGASVCELLIKEKVKFSHSSYPTDLHLLPTNTYGKIDTQNSDYRYMYHRHRIVLYIYI